jgi:hypothetical protein
LIIDGLAVIGAGTCLYGLFRVLSAFLRWVQPTEEAAASPPAAPDPAAVAKDDIVVIAAAVAAMVSAHRIVHINDIRSGASWSAEGRWMHQTSHSPH